MLRKLLILNILFLSTTLYAKDSFSFMDDFSEKVNQALPDGMKLGVTLLTTEADSSGTTEVKGVLFMNYDGYMIEMDDQYSELYLVPTNVYVDVEGKQVMSYVDLATLHYYGSDKLGSAFENVELQVSLLSMNYEKLDNFTVNVDQTVAIADFNAVKNVEVDFFSIGVLQLDFSIGATFGGKTKQDIILSPEEEYEFSDSHFYTVDGIIGSNIKLTDSVDLLIYAGYGYQKNKRSEIEKTIAGVQVYGFKLGDSVEIMPYFEMVKKDYVRADSGLEDMFSSTKDSMLMFGIRVFF